MKTPMDHAGDHLRGEHSATIEHCPLCTIDVRTTDLTNRVEGLMAHCHELEVETTRRAQAEAELRAELNGAHQAEAACRREREAALAEVALLKRQKACFEATRSFWPLTLRTNIANGDIEAVKAETARAEAVVKSWLEDSHALARVVEERDEARATSDLHKAAMENLAKKLTETEVEASRLRDSCALYEKQRDTAELKLGNLAERFKTLEAENDDRCRQLVAVKTDRDNVWVWQGVNDHPESLACPVVMTADTLRSLLEESFEKGEHDGINGACVHEIRTITNAAGLEKVAFLDDAVRTLVAQRDLAQASVARLNQALDNDHAQLSSALLKIRVHAKGFTWITEGRGSYEWDDDRYREEAGNALRPIIEWAEEAYGRDATVISALRDTDKETQAWLTVHDRAIAEKIIDAFWAVSQHDKMIISCAGLVQTECRRLRALVLPQNGETEAECSECHGEKGRPT